VIIQAVSPLSIVSSAAAVCASMLDAIVIAKPVSVARIRRSWGWALVGTEFPFVMRSWVPGVHRFKPLIDGLQ
jgi:hypothetical protein